MDIEIDPEVGGEYLKNGRVDFSLLYIRPSILCADLTDQLFPTLSKCQNAIRCQQALSNGVIDSLGGQETLYFLEAF